MPHRCYEDNNSKAGGEQSRRKPANRRKSACGSTRGTKAALVQWVQKVGGGSRRCTRPPRGHGEGCMLNHHLGVSISFSRVVKVTNLARCKLSSRKHALQQSAIESDVYEKKMMLQAFLKYGDMRLKVHTRGDTPPQSYSLTVSWNRPTVIASSA